MKKKFNATFILIFIFIISCTYIPLDQQGSEILGDGLWLVYVDTPGFGKSVAIDQNIALIGAPNDSVASVHIFEFNDNDWICTASYYCEDSIQNGYAKDVAVSDGIVAISDCRNNKIFTYKKVDSTWVSLTTIVSPNDDEYNYFGISIDLYENYLLVGSQTGPAILYTNINNDWVKSSQIDLGDYQENTRYINVCISENYIGISKGEIFTIERSGDNLANRTDIDSLYAYNAPLDIYDSTIVVGNQPVSTDISGVIVLEYTNNKWKKVQEIEGSDRNTMGPSVGIYSDYLIFGDKGRMPPFGPNDFNIYHYSNDMANKWTRTAQLNYYGSKDVALSDEYAIMGGSGCARIYRYR